MALRMLLNAARLRASALVGGVMIATASVASAQPGLAPAAASTPETAYPATWSSPDMERLGAMLAGVWKTDAAVAVAGGGSGDDAGETVQIVLSIGPVGIKDLPNAMYFEVARADALHAPYRQAVFALFEYRGKVRLRTYEFHNAGIEKAAVVGAWAIPEAFPPLTREQFIATLDVEGTLSAGGFTGQTPAPYPTAVGGAVEMTSRIELIGNRLITEDRGYAADGSIAWGQEAGGRYTYSKIESEVTIDRTNSDGLVVLEYREGVGREVQNGDTFAVHYHGWFSRNGQTFDSSRTRGLPYSYQYPGTMMEGWGIAVQGMKPGTLRRFYAPYPIAYGEQGQPPRMPGRSNLIFEVECVNVSPSAAPAGSGVEAPRPPEGSVDTPQ